MRIVQLTAENIKCLSAVTITPDPEAPVVTVGGMNGAGKSTALDSIEYALGGAGGIPSVPIRTGETKARIVLDLDAEGEFPALRVERRFSTKGGSDLVVTSNGKRLNSPQSILDALKGRVGFDPLAFSRAPPVEQRRILQGLVGLDFTELDTRRQAIFDKRTIENRTVKDLTSQAAGMETFGDAPEVETSASALIDEIRMTVAENAEHAEHRRHLAGVNEAHAERVADIAKLEQKAADDDKGQRGIIAQLESDLEIAKDYLARMTKENRERLANENAEFETFTVHRREMTAAVDSLTDQPTDALQQQLNQCEETNRQVRANAAAKELAAKLTGHREAADALTGQLGSIDDEKQTAMESAEWPVDGLGFSDDGVTLDSLPFDQASQAQQIDVSVAMGFAANPTLRVMLIRDGSLLDDASLARIAKLAAEKDGQVWMERVGEGDCSVIIREGMVAEEADD